MKKKNSDSKTVLRCALILLSVVLLVTSIGVYWRFGNETEIDAGITAKYLEDNNIKLTEFYGTSRFQEIETAIQAKRTSYWHTVYALPIVFSLLAAAAAVLAFLAGRKNKNGDPLGVGSAAFAVSGIFVFVVSLIRLITADFSYLYLTSESGAWRGLGKAAWVLAAVSAVIFAAGVLLAKKGIASGEPKKAAGISTQSDDDDNIFYPVASADETIDNADEGSDADDAQDKNN